MLAMVEPAQQRQIIDGGGSAVLELFDVMSLELARV
jgi:hypothetical protein